MVTSTPLASLRLFLQDTDLKWVEYYNWEKDISLIGIYGAATHTTLYFFDKDQKLVRHSIMESGKEELPDNVPAPKQELPFGGAWPKLPDWWDKC